MALFDLFKPKWKSKNPEVRLGAVQAMGAGDLATLKVMAGEDEDARVRFAAVERIGDLGTLEELAGSSLPPQVFQAVRSKIDLLLFQAVLGSPTPLGAETALEKIEDLSLLERLGAEGPTPALRVRAVERITDVQALCRILEKNCGKEPARAALARIDDDILLARLARSGASKVTRRLAEEKIAVQAAQKAEPDQRALPEREPAGPVDAAEEIASAPDGAGASRALEEVLSAVEALVGSPGAGAEGRFREAEASWAALKGGSAAPELAERFDRACRRYREGRDAMEGERRRFRTLSEALERAEALVESEDLEGVGAALAELEGPLQDGSFRIVDPSELRSRFLAVRSHHERRLAARAEAESLRRREELCAELEGLVEAEDRNAAGRRVRALQRAWRELPLLSRAAARAIEERFRAAEAGFVARQQVFHQQQEWLRWNNKTLKEGLCAEAEALEEQEDLGVLAENVKDLQGRWKEVGPVPTADAQALWERFKEACDRGFERCKPYFEELERLRAETEERKAQLCCEAEAHVDSIDWKESAESLKNLQAQWKEAGPLPRKSEEELYARFRQACNRFFERRQAHFAELEEERRRHQAEKESLCERAEALAAEPERGHTKKFRELQTEWKRIGPAPREVEQALWERFRGACDRFFAWLDGPRLENLRRKEALCEELEALLAGAAHAADQSEVAAAVAGFQKRWAEIGPVPAERAEALGDRFRALCEACSGAPPGQKDPDEATRETDRGIELADGNQELARTGDSNAAEDAGGAAQVPDPGSG